MNLDNPNIQKYWKEFLREHPENPIQKLPEVYYFGDNEYDANTLADLVVKQIKRATATSLWWFKQNNQKLPQPGDQAIATDWYGNPKAIIETTKIAPTPFRKVTAEFARIEGEGDLSLKYWRKVHEAYYQREMEPFGEKFHKDMIIICEHFKVIYSE